MSVKKRRERNIFVFVKNRYIQEIYKNIKYKDRKETLKRRATCRRLVGESLKIGETEWGHQPL